MDPPPTTGGAASIVTQRHFDPQIIRVRHFGFLELSLSTSRSWSERNELDTGVVDA